MNKLISITALIICLMISATYSQNILTLEDAIRIGLENNFDIRIARNNAEISDNTSGYGTAGLLPSVNLSGNYQSIDSDEESNSPSSFGDTQTDSWGGTISLNWTLFDGLKMFIDYKKYNEMAKLGEYQSKYLIENNVVGISRAYFNLVRQEQLLDAARETKEISEIRFRKEEVRRELGGSSSTDYLNAQVAYNRDQSSLLNQELEVIAARKELNVLLGQDPGTEIEVRKEISNTPLAYGFDNLLELTMTNNSELMMAEYGRKVADREALGSYSAFIPRLSLNASYGYSDRTVSGDSPSLVNDITTEKYDAIVGLNLSFNIFNGGRDRIAWQNARLESKNQKLALEDTKNRLKGQLEEKYETYDKQLQRVSLEEQNLQTARQNLELIEEKYRLGGANSLEFRDAQVSLLNSQTALISSRYQARLTRIEIEQLIGDIRVD